MRLALLGDIHGNCFALAAVLAGARRAQVDRLVITGDFIGYYFWPKDIMEMLSEWSIAAVRGNHEDMLIEALERPDSLKAVDAKYGSGVGVAIETLSAAQLDWLCRLPHPLNLDFEGRSLLLCHGSPWNVNHYVYPDADSALFERCAQSGCDWIVLGHTHYPMLKEVGGTTVINPGSVGQPRNRQPGAQWVFLDTISGFVEFKVEEYDRSLLVRECQVRHPELPYLSEILERT